MDIGYGILILGVIGICYLLSLLFSAPAVFKIFLKENPIKYFLLGLCNYIPFLASYIYLLTQTKNAWFGIWITPLYLLQYFYWILAITIFQRYLFTAALFSGINGVLLFLLQIDRHGTSGGFIAFPWDWFIALPILIIFITNHFISFGYIFHKIRKRKKMEL